MSILGFADISDAAVSAPITAEGPGSLLFTGYLDQTEIFFRSAEVLGQDTTILDRLQEKLSTRQGR